MPVYVDSFFKSPAGRYRRMKMSHMIADSEEELHAMADKIGVARRWYQSATSTPHYDICMVKRELAVAAGAVELDMRGMGLKLKELRGKRI